MQSSIALTICFHLAGELLYPFELTSFPLNLTDSYLFLYRPLISSISSMTSCFRSSGLSTRAQLPSCKTHLLISTKLLTSALKRITSLSRLIISWVGCLISSLTQREAGGKILISTFLGSPSPRTTFQLFPI